MRTWLMLVSCLASVASWAAEPPSFEQRRQLLLDAVVADYAEHAAKPSAAQAFFRAEALFALGKVEEGRRLVGRGLDQLEPGNKENRWIHGGNSGFVAWPGMDCYWRCQAFLDEPLKARYRRIYSGAVVYKRLSTSNHKIMAAVTRYLATQAWGPDAFKPDPFFGGKEDDGARFEPRDPTGEKYVRATVAATVKVGPGEYASRPYGAENVLPLLTIAECAQDAALRQQAALAYEYCLAQLAPAWLDGLLATFAPRSYPDAETNQPWGLAALAWVYFGGPPPAHPATQWALRGATSDYRLPAALAATATTRDQPFVHRALINRWALYHWVTPGYVVFSRSPKATGGGFQGQSYPCGVMWREPDTSRCSQLWVTNPAADDNAVKGNEPAGLHTHGVTKYDQQLQYRDTLLWLFDIPRDFRNPYVLGFVPGGYRAAATANGRLFLHYGSVLLALTASEPIVWEPQSGIKAPTGKPRPGDSEFRLRGLRAVVALECAAPAEFPGATPAEQLAAFQQRLLATTRLESPPGETVVGRYTERGGHVLEGRFVGADTLDAQALDYVHWPALENPWMRQPLLGGPLELTVAGATRRYDFDHWTVEANAR